MAAGSHVVIFGATGMTGLCALRSALNAGLKVRAFVRDKARIPDDVEGSVEPFVGDVLDAGKVEAALEGQDSVVVALGTRNDLSPTTMMSTGLANILDGMKKQGLKKISVCLSSFLFWNPDTVPAQFRPVTEDHRRMLEELKKIDDLDWVAVNPPHIADTPPTPQDGYQIEEGKVPVRVVSKHDLGNFLVKVATTENSKYSRKVLGIGTPA